MELQPGGPPPKIVKIADELSKAMSMAVQMSAITAGKMGNGKADRVNSLYVASVGLIGGLHVLASFLGHHGDVNREKIESEDIPRLINPTSTLLAAILLQTMCPQASAEGETNDGILVGAHVTFGPEIVLEAIQQVERIIGRPVDGWIQPSLLRAVRSIAENSDEPMNRFLQQRRATPGNLH